VRELHALITIDPILGASPVRIYFVLNPRAVERIIAALRPADPAARAASCFALIAYDFPFALHQFALTASPIPTERAREIIERSAGLQLPSLIQAAEAMGLAARPVCGFDAAELKETFFPSTQETVTDVLRLSLAQAPGG